MKGHNHQAAIRSARNAVGPEETIMGLAETFKILGDPTRLRIVKALLKEELCVLDVAAVVGISESAVSHQLRLLKTLRLVKQRREGKMAFYALDDEERKGYSNNFDKYCKEMYNEFVENEEWD